MFAFGRRPSLCWLPLQFEVTKKDLHTPELCGIFFLIVYFQFSSPSLSHCAATCGCSCFSADMKNNNRWAVINKKKSRCPSCCCRHSFQIQTGSSLATKHLVDFTAASRFAQREVEHLLVLWFLKDWNSVWAGGQHTGSHRWADAHFWANRPEIKKKNKVLNIYLLAAAHDGFRDTKHWLIFWTLG